MATKHTPRFVGRAGRGRWSLAGSALIAVCTMVGMVVLPGMTQDAGKPGNSGKPAKPTMLAVGDAAPDISGMDRHGKPLKLRDYTGKKHVVVYFFPKAFTPGCSAQTRDLGQIYAELAKQDVEVIGVSRDSCDDLDRFGNEMGGSFQFVSSTPDSDWYRTFGVTGRSTFVIAKDGTVSHVIPNVNVRAHRQAVLDAVAALQAADAETKQDAAPATQSATSQPS